MSKKGLMLTSNVAKDKLIQNLGPLFIPEEANRLFSIVLGVKSPLFSETDTLLLVFFFF